MQEMEKHLFKCTKCGYEVYLQAWKAVCPSCESSYTLVRVVEPKKEYRFMPRYLAAASGFVLLLLTAFLPSFTSLSAITQPLATFVQLLLLVTSILALTGSTFSNILLFVTGVGIAATSLILSLSYAGFVSAALALLMAASGPIDEVMVRRQRGFNKMS